ncbi:hypothetical protein D3C71_1513440 [compost metagenome]
MIGQFVLLGSQCSYGCKGIYQTICRALWFRHPFLHHFLIGQAVPGFSCAGTLYYRCSRGIDVSILIRLVVLDPQPAATIEMVLGQVQGIGIDILRVGCVYKLHYRHRQYAIVGRLGDPAAE